ncbi:MAG: Smr/MutS family protein [Pseudomonadota bacterium]
MANRDKHHLKSRPRLSKEDRALWDVVSKRVTRFEGARRVQASDTRDFADMIDAGPLRSHLKAHSGSDRQVSDQGAAAPRAPGPRTVKAGASPSALDTRTQRRIARGRDDIEGRLDLHGMRQTEAHGALRRFLFAMHGRGARTVLVITGKGAPAHAAMSDRPWEPEDRSARGVLRQRVPGWLNEPDLRTIVIGHAPAHDRHGGGGALYVRLRANNS